MGNEVAVIRDYDIRDRKLVDATAQSTINSTDAIEMKTTDGNQVFIDKASFIKAVGQAFTASDPKTFTKLLGMNGDSPMGIGASDLASVLGVNILGFLRYYGSADVITEYLPVDSRIYQIVTDESSVDTTIVAGGNAGLAITSTNYGLSDHQIYVHVIGTVNGSFATHLLYSSSGSDDGISFSVINGKLRLNVTKRRGTNVRTLLIVSKNI